MKKHRQGKENRKSIRTLAILMVLMMITALVLPIGARASESSDGSASGASQAAVSEEKTEKEEKKNPETEEKESSSESKTEKKEDQSDSSDNKREEEKPAVSEEKKEEEESTASDAVTEKKAEEASSDEPAGKDDSMQKKEQEVKEQEVREGVSDDSDGSDNPDYKAKNSGDNKASDSGNSARDTAADESRDKDAQAGSAATSTGKDDLAKDSADGEISAVEKAADSTITFETKEVTVIADRDAFDTEVTMKVKKVTDPEQLLKMVTAVQEEGGSYTVKAYTVTFYDKNGKEVEPRKPVQVNMNTKVAAPAKSKVVHVKDDDRTEILKADIDQSGASFEMDSFSDIGVATEGKAKIPGSSFDLYLGDELSTDYSVDDLPAGPISEKDLPEVEGYTFENATVGDVQVEEIGTITDEEGNVYVYYTTKDEKGEIKAAILGDGRIRIHLVETDKDTTYDLDADGAHVHIDAPAGAFEEGTYMEINTVELDDNQTARVQEQAAEKLGEDAAFNIQAVDITFFDKEGEKVQPQKAVNVEIATPKAVEGNFCVIHLGDDDTVDYVDASRSKEGSISFSADRFSVYAVVDEEISVDVSIATLIFHDVQGGEIARVFVKNSDTANALKDIIYDPGDGNQPANELFAGWIIGDKGVTVKPSYTSADIDDAKTIDNIRTWAEALNIIQDEVYHIWPMVFKTFSVSFKDEDHITMKSEALIFSEEEDGVDYTINTPYTPKSQDADFQGWYYTSPEKSEDNPTVIPYDGSSEPFKNGTSVLIKDNIVFEPTVPDGFWLSFNENGKGASYTPPQFIPAPPDVSTYTEKPVDPKRKGYIFTGWNTDKDGAGETWLSVTYNNAGEPIYSGSKFGGKLNGRTTLYAQWEAVKSAPYTVVIWKQQAEGEKYDFEQSIQITDTVGKSINDSVIAKRTLNTTDIRDDYARINGTDYKYSGFHFDHYDTGKTIAPEGNTVVNVYYDRNEYQLTFQAPPQATASEGQRPYVYTYQSNDGVTLESNRLYYHNGKWYESYSSYYGYYYNEYKGGVYSSNTYSTVKRITARYGADVSSYFPIVGNNGVTYDQGERWKPQSNSVGWSEVMLSIQTMPAGDVTFRLSAPERPTKTMNYYVEALPGTSGTVTAPNPLYVGDNNTQVNPGNTKFSLQLVLKAKYNQVTEEDFLDLTGFKLLGVDQKADSWGRYIRDLENDGTINIYYIREKYPITYWDGKFFNGDGVPQDETNRGLLHTSDAIYYGVSLADQENSYNPTYDGYEFAGWYLDDACSGDPFDFANSTMPLGGIKLYAKWIKKQYRVFLHPNVPEDDQSLVWGQTNQQMSFRANYNEYIAGGSMIGGTRSDYELIGWYTDQGCTQPFNFGVYKLNDGIVKTPYDKSEPTELNKYGNPTDTINSDIDRFWITRKLDLYAKWRAKIDGAKGIYVQYDAVSGKGHFGTGQSTSTVRVDPVLYLDSAEAIAGAASVADDSENEQFLYWVLQHWNGTNYEDTNTHLYPGDDYSVLKADAREEEITDGTQTAEIYRKYTIQLKAVYGPKEAPKNTHIDWYKNYVEGSEAHTAFHQDEHLQINQAVDIQNPPTRAGYTFLGWARITQDRSHSTADYPPKADVLNLDKNELYLTYHKEDEGGYFTAIINGETKKVTKVAADEVTPYHDMYAVWEKSAPYLNVVKTEAGENSSPVIYLDGAKFTLYKRDNSGDFQTVQADLVSSKSAGSTGVRFNEALADGKYKLVETQAPQNHKIDTPEISFTVTDGELQSNTTGITFDYSIDNDGNNVYTVTVENTRTATVTVTKEVVGLEADQSTGFEFIIKGVAASDQTETLYGTAADGKKHTVTYKNIPYGTQITVEETENDAFNAAYTLNNGTKQDGRSTTFVVSDDTVNSTTNTAELVFTNTRKNIKLKVDKVVANGTSVDLAREFSFSWQAESENSIVKRGTIELTDAAEPVEIEVPVGTKLTVSERIDQSMHYTTTSSMGETTGGTVFVLNNVSVTDDSKIITFTNTRKSGNVNVTKNVAGNMGETDKDFKFTASLKDGQTTLMMIEANGVIKVAQENGSETIEFNLRHTGTKEFADLPEGAELTIVENEYSGYTQKYKVVQEGSEDVHDKRTANVQVSSNGTNIVFTNEKTAVAPTQLHSGTRPMAVLVGVSFGAMILLAAHHFLDRFRNSSNR